MNRLISFVLFSFFLGSPLFFLACEGSPKNEANQEKTNEKATEATKETVAESASETTQEVSSENAKEITPEAGPEAGPETALETKAEVASEAIAEPTVEANPEATPETKPEATPETAIETTSEPVVETAPEAVAEMGPCTWQKKTTLGGHTASVRSVAFSGSQLITISDDKTVKVWDLSTGQSTQSLNSPSTMDSVAAALSSAMSPYNRYIAASGNDKLSKVWDLSGGSLKYSLGPQLDASKAVAFDVSGQYLASGTTGGDIYIYDLSNGQRKEILSHAIIGSAIVQAVTFSGDGNLLASGAWDKKVQIWDAKTFNRTALDTLPGHKGYVLSLAFSPNSKLLAAGTWADGSPAAAEVKLWDVSTKPATLKTTLAVGKGHIRSVAYNPTGSVLAAGSNDFSGMDNYVRLWDASNQMVIATLPTTAGVNGVAFDNTGRFLVAGLSDTKDNLVVWECK